MGKGGEIRSGAQCEAKANIANPLSRLKRVRVALDIARGLAYLHGLDAGVVVGVRSGTLTAVVHLTC